MSLSPETMKTSWPCSAASRASVPMTSSASKPCSFENGNAERFERAANVGNLAPKVVRHRLALGLVAVVAHFFEGLKLGVPFAQRANVLGALVAEDCAARIEDRSKVFRREILAQFADHVHKNVGRRGGQAGARGHGPAALHGVIGAKDKRHRVEKEDGRLGPILYRG